MSDFDLNQVRRLDGGLLLVFRELLRTRRASTVAERLGLSASAVSHSLARLRDLFEDQLFVRRPHGFEPTRRALELGPKIEALVDMAGAALSREGGFNPARSARMFIMGAPEFVTAMIGAELINRLRVMAPKVTFAVTHTAEEDAFSALRRGEIDLALGRFGASRPGFVDEVLYEDCYCIAARVGHPQIHGALDEAGYRSIGHVFAWSQSEVGGDARTDADMVTLAAVPQWLTALVLVASTDGLATCPRRLAERHAERLGLQVLDPPFVPDTITVSAVRRAGVHDIGVDWFLEQVRSAAMA